MRCTFAYAHTNQVTRSTCPHTRDCQPIQALHFIVYLFLFTLVHFQVASFDPFAFAMDGERKAMDAKHTLRIGKK